MSNDQPLVTEPGDGPDHPVRVGSMLYTLVDPEKGHEVAYNRWYERDHYYGGCMTGPWCFAGSRWVATRSLKDLRFPDDGNSINDPVDRGSYLAIYWVEDGHHDDHFAWGADQVVKLYMAGRGFQERHHAHTVLYKHRSNRYRDDDPVPVDVALDHGYDALASVVVEPADESTIDDLSAWVDDEGLPALFAEGPVASCAQWRAVPRDDMTNNAPMDLGSPPIAPDATLQLFFLEADPRECWDRFKGYAERLEASGLGRVTSAAPFLRTVVGTDRYTDELW
ncbi:MAG: hypothetical protein VYC56_00045 [Actinomycetota bacterium]|nr:hypothetical protein [Actinomycetota bacterium]